MKIQQDTMKMVEMRLAKNEEEKIEKIVEDKLIKMEMNNIK